MAARRDPPNSFELLRQLAGFLNMLIFPLLIGGYYSVRWLDEKAPIAYVDKRVDESSRAQADALAQVTKQTSEALATAMKRADERSDNVLKEAMSHSDENRQKMEIARAQDTAVTREAMAKMSAVLEQVSTALREMRSDVWVRDRERMRRQNQN